jgi:hypothetical protein
MEWRQFMIDPYEYIREIENELNIFALSKWIEEAELGDDIDVKILAYNILLDIKYGNISDEWRNILTEKLIKYLDKYRKEYPDSKLIEQIKEILDPKNEEKKQEITCKGKHFTPNSSEILSRAMDWNSIYGRLKRQGDEYIDGYIPQNKNELNQKLHEWKKSDRLPSFRGKAPLYWIFKSEELENCYNKKNICNISNSCYESPCNINFICQKLGKEVNKGTYYYQIIFLPHDIEENFHSPTFFDSMCYPVFRSIYGNWGKTVNIPDGEDGIDEAIHKEGKWPDKFEVTRYGIISEDINFQPLQKQNLCDRLQNEVGSNTITKQLERIKQFIG